MDNQASRGAGRPGRDARAVLPEGIAIGDRVIVRRRLPDTPGHLTDVIGHVTGLDPFRVRPQSVGGFVSSAPEIEIPFDLVQVVKVLLPRRVLNSDIRAVEQATAAAFPGIEHLQVDGWLLRAGDGITERSNSAAPLGASAGLSAVPMQAIEEFYRRHQLPVRLLIPDRIARSAERLTAGPGWTFGPDIAVMTRSVTDPAPLTHTEIAHHPELRVHFTITRQPSKQWLERYHFRGKPLPEHALRLLMDAIDGTVAFGSLLTPEGRTVAITRGTITATEDGRRWLGYSAVEVDPEYRRRGLGTLLGRHMLSWGADNGATDAYLQVLDSNEAGKGLYEGLGFVLHHRHRYAQRQPS